MLRVARYGSFALSLSCRRIAHLLADELQIVKSSDAVVKDCDFAT